MDWESEYEKLLISANEYERLLKDSGKYEKLLDTDNEYWQLVKQENEYEKLFGKSKDVLSLMLSEPDFEKDLSRFLAAHFNKNFDIYDRAIDSAYLKTHIGGSQLHHNLDGNHTIWGAIKAAREASSDDSDFVVTLNAIEHFIRDTGTPSEINPVLSPVMFQSTKDYLLNLGLEKRFINDLLNINTPEIASFAIISIGLLQNWNRIETKKLGEYTGKFLVLAGYAGNPLLGMLVPILISKGMLKDPIKYLSGTLKGSISFVPFFALSQFVPGPVPIGLLVGTIGHLAISKIYDNLFSSEKLEDFFREYFPTYKSYLASL
ncbi:MAG: hypothetical protein AB1349_09000 [Elusimicrobiota bacterium]